MRSVDEEACFEHFWYFMEFNSDFRDTLIKYETIPCYQNFQQYMDKEKQSIEKEKQFMEKEKQFIILEEKKCRLQIQIIEGKEYRLVQWEEKKKCRSLGKNSSEECRSLHPLMTNLSTLSGPQPHLSSIEVKSEKNRNKGCLIFLFGVLFEKETFER